MEQSAIHLRNGRQVSDITLERLWKYKVRITTHYFPFIFLLNFLCCVIFFSSSVLWRCWLEEHMACKKWVTRCWCGYLYGAGCKWLAYGPADATVTQSSCASLKSRLVSLFWCRVTQVVLEKKSLNGCLSVCRILFLVSFLQWTKILHNTVLSYVGTEFAYDITEFK